MAQNNKPELYKKQFGADLKRWTNSFTNFRLSDFKTAETSHFDNNYAQNFDELKTFLSMYKPIITYSADSSIFIDIYSYQLNLEKKGNYYYANPEIDQAILLCNPKNNYWDRVWFGSSREWIDDVIWVSKSKFILVGITKPKDEKRFPILLFGDTNTQTLERYINVNKLCIQKATGYYSQKLRKIKIRGL